MGLIRFRNFLLLLRYWKVLKKAQRLIDDPKGAWSTSIIEHLTLEEMEGVTDLERVVRLLTTKTSTIKKDLKELSNSLNR